MLSQAQSNNFDTLGRAFNDGAACLVECRRKSDGQIVALICAVNRDGDDIFLMPFAEIVNGNPFETYDPPRPEGGFASDESEDSHD